MRNLGQFNNRLVQVVRCLVRCIGLNLSWVKQSSPSPTSCCLRVCMFPSGAERISSLVRHTYVGYLYLSSPFAVYSVCVYVVCACVVCMLRPYQIAALTIQLRTISDPTKRVALAAATSDYERSILNQGSESHINIRK